MEAGGSRAGWRHLLAWMLARRTRVRVTGPSMGPALLDGDHVLVKLQAGSPQQDDVVWVQHPQDPALRIVKRVHAVAVDGAIELRGDSPDHSTDSRHYGPVPPGLVLGRVVWRFPR